VADRTELLARVAADLRSLHARWALVGALAVGIRSEPRFTRDIDIAVAVDSDADAEKLVFALGEHNYQVLASVEHESANRLATIRLAPSHVDAGTAVVDLLFASSGIEPEIVEAADDLEALRGVSVPVASTGHLIALKLLSADDQRPYDLGDLQALLEVASDDDLETARYAVRLITERGYSRGRDLVKALDDAIARFS
jgi:predicted nucleotidyltransferase